MSYISKSVQEDCEMTLLYRGAIQYT